MCYVTGGSLSQCAAWRNNSRKGAAAGACDVSPPFRSPARLAGPAPTGRPRLKVFLKEAPWHSPQSSRRPSTSP